MKDEADTSSTAQSRLDGFDERFRTDRRCCSESPWGEQVGAGLPGRARDWQAPRLARRFLLSPPVRPL